MAADLQAIVGQGGHYPPAAVALMTRRESGPHMHAGLAHRRLGGTSPGLVKTRPAHFQNTAALGNADAVLLQNFDQLIAHFSSRAKKALMPSLISSRPPQLAA
jgi:hypothetical protein